MKTISYVFDPRRSMLMVFECERNIGGYIGIVAERKFERLLLTDAIIKIGRCLTLKEIEAIKKLKKT